MPLYEYECQSCGRRTELLQRFGDEPLTTCPECGGKVRKLFSAPAVQFKGTGWYVTDYGRGNGNGNGLHSESKSEAAAASDKSSSESTAKKSETKTASADD